MEVESTRAGDPFERKRAPRLETAAAHRLLKRTPITRRQMGIIDVHRTGDGELRLGRVSP
jgi:hypothetical protein